MDTPKKPTKKAAKKATKKAVAPTPPPPPEPAWDVQRAQFDQQYRWRNYIADGYEPFAADGGWMYLRKKLD